MSVDIRKFIPGSGVSRLIRAARNEDLGPRAYDLTSALLIPADAQGAAVLRARVAGRLCGAVLFPTIARVYDPALKVEPLLADGAALQPGSVAARFSGPLRSLLAMERVALNFATHLSGIATLTAQYVAAVAGTKAVICDTRKTLPGLRALEKYAVVCGGGASHRFGLHDAVLVKDNHLAYLDPANLTAALTTALDKARQAEPAPKFVEVEVDTLAQLAQVLAIAPPARPDFVLLDNMSAADMAQAVALRNHAAPKVQLEASGGVNLQTVAAIAATGVDRISVGALTHSAPALDLGMDIA